MSRRDTRPRYYIRDRDRDQDQGSNPQDQDQDQDSENTVLRLSRDETVSRDFPSPGILDLCRARSMRGK